MVADNGNLFRIQIEYLRHIGFGRFKQGGTHWSHCEKELTKAAVIAIRHLQSLAGCVIGHGTEECVAALGNDLDL